MFSCFTKNGFISKDSAIQVSPGQIAVIFQSGKILDATAEPGIYTFDESTISLIGKNNKRGYRLGDELDVIVKSANKEARTIDFVIDNDQNRKMYLKGVSYGKEKEKSKN